MLELAGKAALVTGGSRGIGAAIARRLAEAGAAVAVTYNRSGDAAETLVKAIEADGGRAMAVHADNSDPEAIEAAVAAVASAFGRLDILVNNAGIIEAKPFGEVSHADFDRTMDVNVRGAFFATRSAAAHMGEGGRVITIGSNLAERVPMPTLSLYAMSKSALIGFTKAVARDLGERGINVNLVHPGPTNTDMNPEDGELADMLRSFMAIPRYNRAEEIADLVAWLSGPASRGVTGAGFTVDGGTNI